MATGKWTLETWAEHAYSRGYLSRWGNRIGRSKWSEVFHNRFYLGQTWMKLGDTPLRGSHQPLVGLGGQFPNYCLRRSRLSRPYNNCFSLIRDPQDEFTILSIQSQHTGLSHDIVFCAGNALRDILINANQNDGLGSHFV